MLDRAHLRTVQTPALLPSGTVHCQVLMGKRDQGQQLKGRDKRLQEYGTNSTAAKEQVQRREDEMEVRRHFPGELEGATKRTREKAPTMQQLVKVKSEALATELQAMTTISPILSCLPLCPVPHHMLPMVRAVP